MEKEKKIWVAASGTGQLGVYTSQPIREERRKIWLGRVEGCISQTVMLMECDGFELPCLKWSDEPREIVLTLSL